MHIPFFTNHFHLAEKQTNVCGQPHDKYNLNEDCLVCIYLFICYFILFVFTTFVLFLTTLLLAIIHHLHSVF